MGVYRSMKVVAAQGVDPRAAMHRLDEPTEPSLSMVVSPQCRFCCARPTFVCPVIRGLDAP